MPTGPSSSATPYLIGTEPNIRFTAIATVGDTLDVKSDGVTPFRLVGIPDGLGAFDNGDGTITVFLNHELSQFVGIVREHGAIGAFVSELIIDSTTFEVREAKDSITEVQLWNDVTNSFFIAPYAIGRLCSADLADVSAYYFVDDMGTVDVSDDVTYGTQDRIFMTGEEIGSEGKQFGLVVTGAEDGIAYELPYMGLFSWENAVTSNYAQIKTINIGTADETPGQVYFYIGDKKTEGNAVERAGLNDGDLYGLKVDGVRFEANGTIANGNFTLVKLGQGTDTNADGIEDTDLDGDVSDMTGVQLDAQSDALGVTEFLRPEDVHWDPTNASVFYFVTTNAFNNPSRLYKGTLTDIENPELGGTIEAVLDGTEGQQMLDNITVDATGHVIMQEDIGFQAQLSKVWDYDPVTDTLTQIGVHDSARYLPGGAEFKTIDEESSGVIEITNLIGYTDGKAYLLDVQSHNALADPELVQDGQLLAMFIDDVQLTGDATDNDLFGSFADETFTGGAGNDSVRAGSGNDVVAGGAGNDTIDAGAGRDGVSGGGGADQIDGGTGDDRLQGNNGADLLSGGEGNDQLIGGVGDDLLDGGLGRDVMSGGLGADTFVFGSANDSTFMLRDRILDFSSADGDTIDLSAIDANSLTAGDDKFEIVTQFSGTAGELRIVGSVGGAMTVLGDVNGDAVTDFSFGVVADAMLMPIDLVL